MAALSLSSPSTRLVVLQPPSLDFSVMPSMSMMTIPTASARRAPLSNNPNAANSPLRNAAGPKVKRSHATVQREEQYGQPPPLKKQILEHGPQRAVRSPTSQSRTRPAHHAQRPRARAPQATAESTQHQRAQERDLASWQKQYRARFPRMVFYFDSVPDDVRTRLVKPIVYLGAREEKFFSSDVTHVVTTRPLPAAEPATNHAAEPVHTRHNTAEDQPQTINPSLLDCSSESRRKMLLEMGNRRSHIQDDIARPKSARNNDVLYKARDMGKRIYSVEKLHRILENLMERDDYGQKLLGSREQSHEHNLAKLLRKERLNGPSDRDPRAVTRELNYFRGPYIYVYDMDEKTKPIIVREYPKVADKADGEWPQFKTVSQGRCPFVEESAADAKMMKRAMEKKAAKEAASRAAATDRESNAKPVADPAVRATGKRSREEYADPLAESKNGSNGVVMSVRPTDVFNPPKDLNTKSIDFTTQKFFTSRLGTGRVLAGEPVASGVQPSNMTSAIRSQMISSNANAPGAKAGTSKEVHNLQKTVLQKAAPVVPSGLAPSRPVAAVQAINADGQSSRSTSAAKTGRVVESVEEGEGRARRAPSAVAPPPQKSKKDMKPGYCENCQDKFDDFDDHVVSRKHRKFAESLSNWGELDDLLSLLKRPLKYSHLENDDEEVEDDAFTRSINSFSWSAADAVE